MKFEYASAVGVGLILVLTALGTTSAAAAQPQSTAAVWFPYDMIVDLQNLPKRYTCDALWYKFRDVLLSVGARPNIKILPYRCNGQPPRVQLQFALPRSVRGVQVRYADLQAVNNTVRLQPGRPRSLDASDCALLEQMKDTLFAALPVRVVSYRLSCDAPPSSQRRFHLSLQVLAPASRSQEQVAAHGRGGRREPDPPRAPGLHG